MIRKIVCINEEKCNGCGLCIPACHEGAIQIIDGKARLIDDKLCDGLGDCLGECPQGAIEIIERYADPYDEEAVKEHLAKREKGKETEKNKYNIPCGCPGTLSKFFEAEEKNNIQVEQEVKSTLRQWPVQLSLLPVNAPYFNNAELLLVADCVAFAYGDYQRLQKGKAIAVGCPKLDNGNFYVEKLSQILKANNIKSINIARMEVPCCGGLERIVNEALRISGKDIPVNIVIISIQGKILNKI